MDGKDKTHVAETLLARGHSPGTANAIFTDRIVQKPLLLRATSPDASKTTDARETRRKARAAKSQPAKHNNKPKPLSAKRKRALCIYEIPKDQRRYALYEPLHALWCTYMRGILGLEPGTSGEEKAAHVITPAAAGPVLASADYHGALLEMVRSRCVSRVGIRGIVVKDTKFTFEVITAANVVKILPKEHSVFRFGVPLAKQLGPVESVRDMVFEIHGSQFETRPQDRANKKFKLHVDPDL